MEICPILNRAAESLYTESKHLGDIYAPMRIYAMCARKAQAFPGNFEGRHDTPGFVCRILLSHTEGYIYFSSEINSGGDMYGSYTKNENQTQGV